MIVVTGSNGFIGSNLIKGLNEIGYKNIIAVDDQDNPELKENIAHCDVQDFLNIDEFINLIRNNEIDGTRIRAIFHQGACSNTMEWDADFLYNNNLLYSKELLNFSRKTKTPLIYASSASVYGAGKIFKESVEYEDPINLYAYSKFKFDQLVRQELIKSETQIVGLRYFNVYGPQEQHKGTMASVVFHLHNQLKDNEEIKLFEGSEGYDDGEQRRDFIYVEDVVKVNLWFLKNQKVSGIFNVGTGNSQTFNEVAHSVINWNKRGKIDYIPFPEKLKGAYQSYTQANISKLREAGYKDEFLNVQEGVKKYLDRLESWPKNESS
ncbi:MAG: ADP-glyceromanno-heptose 6-epimerase [Pseudomonadota bacterium]|nr:ADP-glyceromanno-heptose 6-epimerase [Pseudomonadota bacterium]